MRLLFATALTFVVLVSHTADARPSKRHHRRTKKTAQPNMPKGWSWPPSRKMRTAGKRCLRQLTTLGVRWKHARARKQIATPIIVPTMMFAGLRLSPTFRKGPFVLDCHLALALAHSAPLLSAAGVTELRFSTIYQYRKVRLAGRTKPFLSRHALGLAVDVYQIRTADQRVHIVKRDYQRGSPALLACERIIKNSKRFRTALTPGNDPKSHHDHFHLEARMPLR